MSMFFGAGEVNGPELARRADIEDDDLSLRCQKCLGSGHVDVFRPSPRRAVAGAARRSKDREGRDDRSQHGSKLREALDLAN